MAFRSTGSRFMAGVNRSKDFRLTLEQLRIYKKRPKSRVNPCADVMMRLINALEASEVSQFPPSNALGLAASSAGCRSIDRSKRG
mmetsp:Transcript_7670/g.18920  ORF Transcript_7670/g.18920 Transcript_7670/m.18920 type:complete len:85 (-) Transcript_7670:92-346(-)